MQLQQDVHYALRKLRRSPGFALTAILTLALGVGATTAVFSVIDAVLLRPLPFSDPHSIVVPESRSRSGYTQPASLPSYRDERAQQRTFAALAGYNDFSSVNLESPHGPVALHATKGTDNFFDVFGVRPIMGRTFLPGEDQPGRDDVVVLSHEVWQRDFEADPKVIGRVARLDEHPYTIIGIMPADFRFPLGQRNAVYTPLHADPLLMTRRGSHWLRTIGRMKPGVSRQRAQADLQLALGATRANVVRTITGRAATMVAAGAAAGAVLTLLAGKAIAAVLPESHGMRGAEVAHLPADQTMVFLVIAAVLFLIGLLAAMLPARRAATIDPITALRTE